MYFGFKILKCIKQSVLASNFSNSFRHNQAEQIKKGVICVQILLAIHLTEHSSVDRKTLESVFKVEQLHLHTCHGYSNVVFVL